jgi:hypothetical protein
MVKAISLTYSGEQIGYASSLEEAELAKANAREYLSSEILREISFEETRTEAHNIANSEVLCDIIVDTLQKDLTQVTEVYVGNTLICAVDDPVGARRVIKKLLEESAILFPEEAVSFANDITTKSVYYNVDETVSTVAELEQLLSDPTTLQIQHAQCLESIAYTEFETVEKLFIHERIARVEPMRSVLSPSGASAPSDVTIARRPSPHTPVVPLPLSKSDIFFTCASSGMRKTPSSNLSLAETTGILPKVSPSSPITTERNLVGSSDEHLTE